MNKGALQREIGENKERGQKLRVKRKILPNFHTVSQKGNVGPNVSGAGGTKQQVVDLDVLVAMTRLEMESVGPSRDASVKAKNTAFPIVLGGEPLKMSPRERPTEL